MPRRTLLPFTLLALAGLLACGWFVHAAWLSQPEAGAPIEIVVEEGMTASEVRTLLAKHELVSSFGYGIYARVDASAGRPKAGTYTFRRGVSYAAIARTLAIGPGRQEREIRVIEGKTLDETRALLGPDSEPPFTALAGRSKNAASFDRSLIKDYPFLSSIPTGMSLEGYLFPDTYRVWEDTAGESLARKQLDEFREKVAEPFAEQQKKTNMSWHEIVTLASMVEAEARTPEDRKIVAGIFLNRLNGSMRLQSDATLNYIIGQGRARATAEDLKLESPYNSYTHDGLPPGPINNPSLSALRAVLEPAKTNYYFFLMDDNGKAYYGRNLDEHIRNRQQAYGQ